MTGVYKGVGVLKIFKDLEDLKYLTYDTELQPKNGDLKTWGYKQALQDNKNLGIKWIERMEKKKKTYISRLKIGNFTERYKNKYEKSLIEVTAKIKLLKFLYDIKDGDKK